MNQPSQLLALAMITALTACNDAPSTDRNGDGLDDVFYEDDGAYNYVLFDNNFDGQVDESWRYNRDNVLLSAKLDYDFDGTLDSEHMYEGINATDIYTDSNGNGVPDIYTKMEGGTGVYTERYFAMPEEGGGRIARVEYEWGFPGQQTTRMESISEKEFAIKKLNESTNSNFRFR